jgi:hypothetical protein
MLVKLPDKSNHLVRWHKGKMRVWNNEIFLKFVDIFLRLGLPGVNNVSNRKLVKPVVPKSIRDGE